MALADQAMNAALGLSMAKLKGPTGQAVNIAQSLVRRAINTRGNGPFQPKTAPGSRDPLSAGRARSDPLLSFNWYCDLPTIDGVSLGWEFVEEATLPLVEFEPTTAYRAGKMYSYAGHYSVGTLSLKLYEDSSASASYYMDAWRRRILNLDSGLYNVPRDYKQTIKFTILDVTKLTVMFLEYTGCWPTRSDPLQMTSGTSDRIVHSVELSVDEMRLKFGKFEPGQVPSLIDNIGSDYPPRLSNLPSKFPGNFVDLAINGINSAGNAALSAIKSVL